MTVMRGRRSVTRPGGLSRPAPRTGDHHAQFVRCTLNPRPPPWQGAGFRLSGHLPAPLPSRCRSRLASSPRFAPVSRPETCPGVEGQIARCELPRARSQHSEARGTHSRRNHNLPTTTESAGSPSSDTPDHAELSAFWSGSEQSVQGRDEPGLSPTSVGDRGCSVRSTEAGAVQTGQTSAPCSDRR